MAARMSNARTVTIYKDPDNYAGQVGVAQLANGDVVVVFNEMRGRQHLDFDAVALIRSVDNGQTWGTSTKTMVWDYTHHFGSDMPSIALLSDGRLLVSWVMTGFVGRKGILEDFGPQSERLENMRELDGIWLTESEDDGYTWAPAYKANVAPLRWGQVTDEVTELPNGTLVMAAMGQMRARTYHIDEEPIRCFMLRSDTGGLDWEYWSTIAYDPAGIISFEEPALGRTADGVLVCMMRTEHQPRGRHQNMWFAYSTNDGESWSVPEPTELWGYPADFTRLQDGRMLCTYGYRRDPWGVRVCVSEDGLRWHPANELTVRVGGVAPPEAVPGLYWHIGYPTSIQLHDGTILTVDHQWTQEEPYVQYVVGMLWELA